MAYLIRREYARSRLASSGGQNFPTLGKYEVSLKINVTLGTSTDGMYFDLRFGHPQFRIGTDQSYQVTAYGTTVNSPPNTFYLNRIVEHVVMVDATNQTFEAFFYDENGLLITKTPMANWTSLPDQQLFNCVAPEYWTLDTIKFDFYHLIVSPNINYFDPSATYYPGSDRINGPYAGGGTLLLQFDGWPTDDSEWIYYGEPNPLGQYFAGNGWASSVSTHTYLNDFFDDATIDRTESLTVICRGTINRATLSINESLGEFTELLVRGNVPYVGNNHSQLPKTLRNNTYIQIGARNITFKWLNIHTESIHAPAIWLNLTNCINSQVVECYITRKTGYSPIQFNNVSQNKAFRRCIVKADGVSTVVTIGYGSDGILENNIFMGYLNSAINFSLGGNSSNRIARNNFAVINTGNSYVKGTDSTNENNASSDSTGEVTGYGTEQFVDFANEDYRIRADSPLHALGIGAFFEDAPNTETSVVPVKSFDGIQFKVGVLKVRIDATWTIVAARV